MIFFLNPEYMFLNRHFKNMKHFHELKAYEITMDSVALNKLILNFK
jgi:hypothetical protein